MKPPLHRSLVLATPWPGIFCTQLDSARHYPRHSHTTHGFGLIEQGAQRSASGRGQVDAHAGDLITTNPGEVHDGRPLDGPTRRWRMVYLDPGVMRAMTDIDEGDVEFTRPAFDDPHLRRVVQALFDRLHAWHDGATDALACEEALVHACGLLLERHATRTAPAQVDADVSRARDRLAADLLQPPSLGELAALTGLGKYQLLRRFAKACGVPPHAWLVQQRAEHARQLIRQGAGLAAAAAASGFADQSHMTRTFVRQFGFTPGVWRSAVRLQQRSRPAVPARAECGNEHPALRPRLRPE
ncbi:MAG TPA: AraC family transcriptional regulator [Albitalea sp.]|uniref:AraC family transcriptional regulator n=1 Tax=Piscinibacter sp. TaxID=1903157 RepID=UPI002ED2434F